MSKYIEKVENMTLPALPMRGLVIFPGVPTSFEINKYNYYSDKYDNTLLPKESVEMQFEDVTYQVPAEE